MKMINRVWMLFLSAVLSAGAVGCGCMELPAEKKIVVEMEEKYGEEFRFVEWRTLNFGSESCTAHLECDSFPGKLIKAGRETARDGDMIYLDNYMGYLFEDAIRAELESTVKCIYPESKVLFFVPSSQFPRDMGPKMNIEDILHDKDTLLAAMILVEQQSEDRDQEQQLEQLRSELEERRLRVDGNLFLVSDGAVLEEINESNYFDWTARDGWFSGRCYFATDQNYDFLYANWR